MINMWVGKIKCEEDTKTKQNPTTKTKTKIAKEEDIVAAVVEVAA
jgi:hypothetical protein